jgi:hypothetical protein
MKPREFRIATLVFRYLSDRFKAKTWGIKPRSFFIVMKHYLGNRVVYEVHVAYSDASFIRNIVNGLETYFPKEPIVVEGHHFINYTNYFRLYDYFKESHHRIIRGDLHLSERFYKIQYTHETGKTLMLNEEGRKNCKDNLLLLGRRAK